MEVKEVIEIPVLPITRNHIHHTVFLQVKVSKQEISAPDSKQSPPPLNRPSHQSSAMTCLLKEASEGPQEIENRDTQVCSSVSNGGQIIEEGVFEGGSLDADPFPLRGPWQSWRE